jgi:N-hydroxyarylamine O-acetyltransferase
MTLQIDAYFKRIGWSGERAATLTTLSGILRAHMETIPFENIDVLLGRGVRVDLASIEAKLVAQRRGGYCFEHATLLGAALEQLGFRITRHAARVTMLAPRTQTPRTHMFLVVAIDGARFVVDPGFGLLAPRVPVPLVHGERARFAHETHWMENDGAWWVLRTETEKTIDAWATTLEEENPIDFEIANHFTSTHPASPFVNRLMLRALTADGRVSVMNRDVMIVKGGKPEASQLTDRAALRALLASHFGFDMPEIESMRIPSVPEWA